MAKKIKVSKRPMSSFQRKMQTRTIRDRVLIVCEGEKTEPNYFRSFQVTSAVLIEIRGTGSNTDSLVREAIKEKNKVSKTPEAFDQVWCVFDRDSFPPQNFNNALVLAEQNEIMVAYSNEAFELWYLLHFNFMQSALSRRRYQDMLSAHLGYKYEKNSNSFYDIIRANENDAIRNAERLLQLHPSHDPANNNPSTTVHLLVTELRKLGR